MRPRGVRQPFDQLERRSRALVEWRAADLRVSPLTAGDAELVRPFLANVDDERGVQFTAPIGWPSWTVTDGAVGLLLGTGDSLALPIGRPQPMVIGYVMVERGTIDAADGTPLWAIGRGGTERLEVTREDGPRYRVTLTHDGESVSGETILTPTIVGDPVAVYVEMDEDGRVRIGTQDDPDDPISWTAYSAAHPSGLPVAWSDPVIEINARDESDHGDTEARALFAVPDGVAPKTIPGWRVSSGPLIP